MSAARIIAYIQLELEERAIGKWVGWETCLRYYRKWLKTDPDEKVKDISEEIDKNAVAETDDAVAAIKEIITREITYLSENIDFYKVLHLQKGEMEFPDSEFTNRIIPIIPSKPHAPI